MNTLEFLQHVLPSEGLYVMGTVDPQVVGMSHGFFNTIEELERAIAKKAEDIRVGATKPVNIYFAVGSFLDRKTGRKQINSNKLKAFFFDVDCGFDHKKNVWKPFKDWKEGLRALGDFVAKYNLPKPMIVSSGNGLHVYWVLTHDLDSDDWKPIAEKLKGIMPEEFDPSVPADSARVLRPLNTVNVKGNGTVKVLIHADPVDPDAFASILDSHAPKRTVVYQQRTSTVLENMAVTYDYPPANPDVLLSKCAQLRWAVDNQKDVSEPMWYSVLGIAAYCTNPEETAINWSKEYPTYDEAETLRKLAQWKNATTGPATCARFDQDRPSGCKGCRFKDKIGTPVRLGLQYQEKQDVDDAPDDIVKLLKVPKPFKRTDTGMKYTIDGTDIDVCKFDIYPVSYGRDETLGYEVVRYRWNRQHVGWQTLQFRQAYLAAGSREFAAAIADQGIVLQTKELTERFQTMLRAYMDELRQMRAMTNLYATMGWKELGTQFLLGDTLMRSGQDGTVTQEKISITSNSQRSIDTMFGVQGTASDFAAFTSLLEKLNMPCHMFALGLSLAAPLVEFTGLKGMTINLYGPTGSGKTLAQLWMQSVWGDPIKLHFAAKFTQNALYHRFGTFNNLPVTIDESTIIPPKEIGEFLYNVSQGREKARLTKNSEEREAKTWATLCVTSANKSFGSMLLASGLEVEAQMARLLEVSLNVHPVFARSTDAGLRIHTFLSTHYGAVGRVFVEHLLQLGPDGIRAMIDQHRQEFADTYKVKFSGQERYWELAIMLADLSNKVAKSLGLIQYDYTKGTQFVIAQLKGMRKQVRENVVDSFDLVAEYLNEFANASLTIMHTGGGKGTPDYNRMPRNELFIRFDLYKPTPAANFDRGTVTVDRKHFKKWLALKGSDYRTVQREITEEGVNATPTSEKMFMGKDAKLNLPQTYVFGINLNHPRLRGILDDADEVATNSSLGSTLSVIKGGKDE